ncbi:TetR/AcrR family transcriptional regulator [Mycolicibacterium sphagni]|uniref:TetR/AcrR family transcriptional regulator n=1 Tax=Mycolicibacterium sphagni TaxID=1786 RepID=UPI0021F30808|nr:TetR/AcrR family transcriptional regulator [Mycolicibacterium sphagni]
MSVSKEVNKLATGRQDQRPSSGPAVRQGRRQDRSLDATILDAALSGVAAVGYDRLTMDDVAGRAGVGKAAIYRRWASKAEVVANAIAQWRRARGPIGVPDTGSLRSDIEALIEALPAYDENDASTIRVVLGVATAAVQDATLAAAIDDFVLSVPRQVLGSILDRAVTRGEIPPDRDLSLLPDVVMGLNMVRMVSGRPVDQLFVRRVLEDIVLPLAGCRG